MKARTALALAVAALLAGLAAGAYLGARIVLGRVGGGLGSIFGGLDAEPEPPESIELIPGQVVPGRVPSW